MADPAPYMSAVLAAGSQVPVAARAATLARVASMEGRASKARVWSTSWTWAYRPSVSVGVEWRASSWATLMLAPLWTRRLM